MSTHNLQLSYDWMSPHFPLWDKLLPRSGVGSVLEIGCYEGRSTLWFMDRYPNADITCIDTFEGGHDHKQLGIDFSDTERHFRHNTGLGKAECSGNLALYVIDSFTFLAGMNGEPTFPEREHVNYDIILVDGSHTAADVLGDVVLAWPLLTNGGTMILDDYGWGTERPAHERPTPAIDAFLTCYAGQYELLEKGYQVIVKKL